MSYGVSGVIMFENKYIITTKCWDHVDLNYATKLDFKCVDFKHNLEINFALQWMAEDVVDG